MRLIQYAVEGASCARSGCKAAVFPDDHCYQCNRYICTDHRNNVPGTPHRPDAHWRDEEDE